MFLFPAGRAARRTVSLAVAMAAAVALAGCGTDADAGAGDGLQVVTAFYPLRYVTEQVAGDQVEVSSLTKPGAEPHDLELAPQDVAAVEEADLLVYLDGFQPAVDDAIAQAGTENAFDVTTAADLVPLAEHESEAHEAHDEHGEQSGHEEPGEHEEHADDEHGHEEGGTDPHFWLDPVRLGKVADAVAGRLAEADPDHADRYRANADRLDTELRGLDERFRTGLRECANPDLVTSHDAFGYLADRYGFEQVGIAGLSPDAEPSPAEQAELTEFVREHDVRTIYYETLVDPTIAKSIADETGADVAVLDPLEGLTEQSAGNDYPSVMRANLATLQKGQGCT